MEEVIYEDLTIPVDYGRIALFRIDGEIYALHITGPPTNEIQRINYEWMGLGDRVNVASIGTSEWSEAFEHHPDDRRGKGFADESQASTVISMGPITVDWSHGDKAFGWLYLSEAKRSNRIDPIEFEMHPVQIDNLGEVVLLNDIAWRPVRATK